ncbi:TolC family protein [Olivibacter sp. 47]|uniref:TolC family protein n=1 Tax=Olivibacter sp. 47 TaxID=3056486 RepID=UPI0025A40593|nr:TolC family protein [Olivibacter sp. 47]MDM8177162.1 TolC family protein [Olivibacter sp. 47]
MNFLKYNIQLGLCLVITLLSPVCGRTQQMRAEALSLEKAWQLADLNSKKIQISEMDVQASAARLQIAKDGRLPEVSIHGQYAYVFNMPIYEDGLFHTPKQFPVDRKYYKAGAEAYLNLYNGGKTGREIKYAKKEQEIVEVEHHRTAADIHFSVAVHYYDVYRNQAYRTLLLHDIKEREKQLEEIKQLYANGTVLKSDVLRAELRLSKQRMLLIEINNSIKIAGQRLNVLIGKPDDTPVQLDVDTGGHAAFQLQSLQTYLDEAHAHAFNGLLSGKAKELRALNLQQVKSNTSPKVGFFAEYGYGYPQIQFYPYSLALYGSGMAGIKLSIPISGLYTNKHKVQEASLALKQQEIAYENAHDEIRQAVEEAYLRCTEAMKKIEVAKENIKQAAESYRIMRNTYFNQLSLLTDFLDAETQLLQSRFELSTAQANAQVQFYKLQRTIGNL